MTADQSMLPADFGVPVSAWVRVSNSRFLVRFTQRFAPDGVTDPEGPISGVDVFGHVLQAASVGRPLWRATSTWAGWSSRTRSTSRPGWRGTRVSGAMSPKHPGDVASRLSSSWLTLQQSWAWQERPDPTACDRARDLLLPSSRDAKRYSTAMGHSGSAALERNLAPRMGCR